MLPNAAKLILCNVVSQGMLLQLIATTTKETIEALSNSVATVLAASSAVGQASAPNTAMTMKDIIDAVSHIITSVATILAAPGRIFVLSRDACSSHDSR